MDIPKHHGSAQAAILAAMIACLTLALVNLTTEISTQFKDFAFSIGRLWMPGAEGIGPYSGKETISFLVWILSWLVLSRLFKKRSRSPLVVISIFLVGIGVATTLLWPPVFNFIVHHFFNNS
ncbi:MAG: hypothetical protein HYS98_01170 [Deltaproteobacteria bacterium]|nr:hypothetical protein [Deltaproteobacteria bacterium]